jgi:hypothetical protein
MVKQYERFEDKERLMSKDRNDVPSFSLLAKEKVCSLRSTLSRGFRPYGGFRCFASSH